MTLPLFRDIKELKIWGNDNGMRFLRDPNDKTKYKVYFTDDDVDKLEAFVRQQQAEIEALKAKTLTDEEIYKIANSIETIQPQHGLRLSNDLNVMEFARAILRKAQEK